eukprot:196288_1
MNYHPSQTRGYGTNAPKNDAQHSQPRPQHHYNQQTHPPTHPNQAHIPSRNAMTPSIPSIPSNQSTASHHPRTTHSHTPSHSNVHSSRMHRIPSNAMSSNKSPKEADADKKIHHVFHLTHH